MKKFNCNKVLSCFAFFFNAFKHDIRHKYDGFEIYACAQMEIMLLAVDSSNYLLIQLDWAFSS